MSQYKRVIVLLADGSRPDVMKELLDRGELPAIQKHLSEGGSHLEAVTAFPSTTGPAYMPFLTGCLPATCNVPGIRWVDKVRFAKSRFHLGRFRSYVGPETYLMGGDMRRDLATLFELLPRSYNIFNSVNKGVRFQHNMTRLSRFWYWYYGHLTDRWNFIDKTSIQKFTRVLRKPFEMIFIILPGVDVFSHMSHYRNPETIEAYRQVDRAVQIAYDELSGQGLWDDTLFWLVSDHGLSETKHHFCLNEFLEGRGIRTFYYPKIFKKGCVAANMMSGNGMSHLYFKHDHGWQYPMYLSDIEAKYPGMIDDLLREDAIDILATRVDPHTISAQTRRGAAKMVLEGEKLKYIVEGSDPFGYDAMPESIHADEMLKRTIHTDYPDAPFQLTHLFASTRTGDVVVSATSGHDLRLEYEDPEHKGSHGSLHREHMLVPLLTNAKLNARGVRTIDVFPTTLSLMGHPIPANIDGNVIEKITNSK